MTIAAILVSLILQQVYAPADFTQVAGSSLKARYDAGIAQGRAGTDETFWIAYRFPVRSGVRITTWDNGTNISSTVSSDGIEWVQEPGVQRVAIFLLTGKMDRTIQRTRLINLDQNFRVHDRRVYWLGEPSADESLSLLTGLIKDSPQRLTSSLTNYMTLHSSPDVAARLLELARTATNPSEVRRNAIYWLGQEVSRAAGEELARLSTDPDTEVQKQAVQAISRRNADEAIPALIRVAKEHPALAVRKQAIIWLGQKQDPRVLDFFEQMLKSK